MPQNLSKIGAFMLDMDGTIYVGETLLPGARRFIDTLDRLGRNYVFFTNNSSRDAAQYQRKLRRMGIRTPRDRIVTSGTATALYLSGLGESVRAYVLGVPSFEREMERAGIVLTDSDPEYVVLGFDKTLTYQKLEKACFFLQAGAKFVAAHPDIVCPTERGNIPDIGSMIAMIKAATGVSPKIIGKPYRTMVDMALRRMNAERSEAAIIGDRLYTDIRMGKRAGITTVLVLSGETKRHQVHTSKWKPDHVFPSLKEVTAKLGS